MDFPFTFWLGCATVGIKDNTDEAPARLSGFPPHPPPKVSLEDAADEVPGDSAIVPSFSPPKAASFLLFSSFRLPAIARVTLKSFLSRFFAR